VESGIPTQRKAQRRSSGRALTRPKKAMRQSACRDWSLTIEPSEDWAVASAEIDAIEEFFISEIQDILPHKK
jgi:hypothetical protein